MENFVNIDFSIKMTFKNLNQLALHKLPFVSQELTFWMSVLVKMVSNVGSEVDHISHHPFIFFVGSGKSVCKIQPQNRANQMSRIRQTFQELEVHLVKIYQLGNAVHNLVKSYKVYGEF